MMNPRTKERILCVLIGLGGMGVGGWLCWLSAAMLGYCEAGDWVGLGAGVVVGAMGVVVGAMGVVLVLGCAGMVAWMVGDERKDRDCAR